MALQRHVFQPFKKPNSITHIFVGIDFGTSFTKVSYSVAPSTGIAKIHTLKWDNPEYEDGYVIPTVLYLQDAKLYFEKPEDKYETIKYFKYSMLAESLINNHQNTNNPFEEMCCVYYLAQLITKSLDKIKKEMKLNSFDGIQIFINMGAPLENFYKEKNKQHKELYLEILENAIVLAGGSKVHAELPENYVTIASLDLAYTEIRNKKAVLNWKAEVVPELAAELFLYQLSKNIPEGLYAIIDVGGGTVDMAVFEKYKYRNDAPEGMYCLSEDIKPYGVEILDRIKSEEIEYDFKTSFNALMEEAKKKTYLSNISKVDVFFLGGGATNPWYRNAIVNATGWLRQSFLAKFNFKLSIEDFIENEFNEVLEENRQRLLISQMIARNSNDFPQVKGYPTTEREAKIENTTYVSNDDPYDLYDKGSYYWD